MKKEERREMKERWDDIVPQVRPLAHSRRASCRWKDIPPYSLSSRSIACTFPFPPVHCVIPSNHSLCFLIPLLLLWLFKSVAPLIRPDYYTYTVVLCVRLQGPDLLVGFNGAILCPIAVGPISIWGPPLHIDCMGRFHLMLYSCRCSVVAPSPI